MAYVDSSGKTHISLSEASHGYTATHTASRDASGSVVGDSTGSRYIRQQEAEKAAVETERQNKEAAITARYTTQQQQQNIQQKPIGPIGASIVPINQESITGATDFLKRTWGAMEQGYQAGKGKAYSIAGLVAPQNKNTYTNSIYEKTEALGKRYDTYQNSLLSSLPSGVGKDFVTGVTNVPEMIIKTVGGVAFGSEAIVRNPTRISDSVSFGLGAMGGATVAKAQTHPGELVGELVGSFGVGKAAGSTFAKVTPKKVRTISETTTERQFSVLEGIEKTKIETLGTPREYFKLKTKVSGENELNPSDIATAKDLLSLDKRTFNVNYKTTLSKTNSDLNTEITAAEGKGTITLKRPNIIQAEQKTLTGDSIVKIDKGKWEADLSGIQTNKMNFRKQYSVESYEGRENFEYDFATNVENSRIRIINEVLPEKKGKESSLPANANEFFDVPRSPKQMTLSDNYGATADQLATVKYRSLNLLPGERPGFFAFDKVALNKNNFKNTVRRLTADESGELLPVQELKTIGGRPKAELDIWKRDILLEELEPKTTVTSRSFSIPNTYSSSWGLDAAGLGIISSSYLTDIGRPIETPATKKGIWDINTPQIQVNTAGKSNVDIISGNRLDLQQGIIPGIKQDIIPDIRPDIQPYIIPDIRPDIIPDIRPPDIRPDVIPDIRPDNIPDIQPDIEPTINPTVDPIIEPTIDPIFLTEDKIQFPFSAGDFNFNPGKEGYTTRRKTKNRKLKNKYGDPFKVGIKIKL